MNVKDNFKKKIVTMLIFTSLVLSACSKKENNELLSGKKAQLMELCTIDNVIEYDALRQIYNDQVFVNTEEIIDTLEAIEPSILHIGEVYVSVNGGPIEIVNYYGEQIMEYNGGEIPYGCYLNQDGKLVRNCVPIICYTENGIAYSLPIGYTLKSETVIEESISYTEFLTYSLEDILGEDSVEKGIKF